MVSPWLLIMQSSTPWRRWQVSVLPLSYRSGAEKQPLYLLLGVLQQTRRLNPLVESFAWRAAARNYCNVLSVDTLSHITYYFPPYF